MSTQHRHHLSEQEAVNIGWDNTFDVPVTLPVESDGTNIRRAQTKLMAVKVTISGDDTYVAYAPIGTAQSSAAWQCKKIAVSGSDITITWADGNANFDNVATDLTALSYS